MKLRSQLSNCKGAPLSDKFNFPSNILERYIFFPLVSVPESYKLFAT